jgi:hypothetical protein
MPMDAIPQAAQEVLKIIAEMCQAAGIFKQVPPQLLEEALLAAFEMLKQQAGQQQPEQQPAQPAAQPAEQPMGA